MLYSHKIVFFYIVRADYWKSQAKKYCDFCKCWIADNKPSVDFHEKGRRHKENVQKRLKTIQKQSKKDAREACKLDSALIKMETAALEAYRKDVQNSADLTSIEINKKVESCNLQIKDAKKLWHEAKSKEGHTYFWNILTNESLWEPPKDGYVSLEEQRDQSLDKTRQQIKVVQKHDQLQARLQLEQEKREEEEERARLAREKLKDRRVEDIEPVVAAPIIPSGKTNPYGEWKTVQTNIPTINLQLPEVPQTEVIVLPEAIPEPAPKEYKEKTVESLRGGNTEFKKRTFGMAARRNVRQRLDEDD